MARAVSPTRVVTIIGPAPPPTSDPCASLRDQVAALTAQLATRTTERDTARADATAAAATLTRVRANVAARIQALPGLVATDLDG